jgi:hypothetical protein
MALTLGSLTFSGTYNRYGHAEFGAFVSQAQRTTFPGSLGITELRDPIKGREISFPYRVGATTLALLVAAIDNLSKQAGQVNGTLNWNGARFRNTTFLEFTPATRITRVAGAGSLAWKQQGTLRFLQLSTTVDEAAPEPEEP